MENTGKYSRPLLAAGFLIICVTAWLLCEIPRGWFTDTDELLTAERTREMLLLGRSAVHLNFEPSFNKPPLQDRLGTVTLNKIENRQFALRMWPLLFGILTAAALAWLAFLIDRKRPWLIFFAVAILFSCPLYLPEISRAYLDSGLTFFTTLAIAFSHLARKRPIWWMATAVACWLGAIQKIPIAYLIWLLILITRLSSSRERARLRTPWLFAAIILSVAGLIVLSSIQNGRFVLPNVLRISEAKIVTGPNQLGKHLFLEIPLRLIAFWPFGVFVLAAAIACLTSRRLRLDRMLRELAIIFLAALALLVLFNFRSVRYLLPVLPVASLILPAVILRLPKTRPLLKAVAIIVGGAFCIGSILESAAIIHGRRRDVSNEQRIARRIAELQRPGLPIFVIRTHLKEIEYQTFYLFYGDLHFPTTELVSEQIPAANITAPAIGICARRDLHALQEKLLNATVDLQLGNVICWRVDN